MAQENAIRTCPICGGNYVQKVLELENKPSLRYECGRCGSFEIDRVLADIKAAPWLEVRHLVSAWIRQQNKVGLTPVIADGWSVAEISSRDKWKEEFQHMGFQENVNGKLDALLLAYAEMAGVDYQRRISTTHPYLIAEIAAHHIGEINGLTTLLTELGYVREIPGYGHVISADGWLKIDELRKSIIARGHLKNG